MTDVDLEEYKSAIRMTAFFAANETLLEVNPKAVSLNAALSGNIGALGTTGAKRVSAAGLRSSATADKQAAKDAVFDYVRRIAATAKTIKKEEPDFDNKFKVPRGNLNNQALIDAANAFVADLVPAMVTKFNEYGIGGAVGTNLKNKVTAFEAARADQNTGKGGGVAATAQTKAAIADLKKNRRAQKLIVANMLADNGDAGLIAEWQSACKIEKPKPDVPPAPPTP